MAVIVMSGLLGISIGSPAAWAQSNETPGVDAREARQQGRIADGVASGQLTPREAARLERGEARIDRMEQRAKADGVVTPKERAKLQGALNRESRAIARQKHDAQRR
ncbi:MAG TPA: hypothetical protein VFA38_06890 [Nitrospirales bacterium]|nr:hypothetical protein [Nitrospirales bacterium]